MESIPICILHKDEPEFLFQMVSSIMENTYLEYSLFIVDNNSQLSESLAMLKKLSLNKNITIIYSRKNDWILGFNLALKSSSWPLMWEYAVFSDSDIIVPQPVDGVCWLSHLVQQMDSNACIGKLGLPLKISDLPDDLLIKGDVYANELRFYSGEKIGSNYISPVDTTLAIYRRDFFVTEEFKFSVGHASLARPYYYTCRCRREFEAVHLGWYKKPIKFDSSANVQLSGKIRCFALYAAYVEPKILKGAKFSDRLFFKLVKPIAYIFWSTLILLKISLYILSRFPRRLNEKQFRAR